MVENSRTCSFGHGASEPQARALPPVAGAGSSSEALRHDGQQQEAGVEGEVSTRDCDEDEMPKDWA